MSGGAWWLIGRTVKLPHWNCLAGALSLPSYLGTPRSFQHNCQIFLIMSVVLKTVVPRPIAMSMSFGNLLEMQILGLYSRHTQTKKSVCLENSKQQEIYIWQYIYINIYINFVSNYDPNIH